MLILLNAGIFVSIMLGRLLQAIFFGQLRPIEVEHLYEKSWYAVTETCLAMTIFRDEFDIQFVIVFTTLLFLKIFHWLCQDRVEYMEQTPAVPLSFHARMVTLVSILLAIDCRLASRAISTIMVKGPNMMIMFGFEYAILTSSMLSTIGKYTLNVIEGRMDEPWESKSIFVFYLDLVTDFFKLITYVVFFAIICNFYGLPLHIIRDVYVTFRSFIQKCRDLYRYRRATRNMNELYPDATEEDLRRMSDSTCIICREDMQIAVAEVDPDAEGPSAPEQPRGRNSDIPKKLPCGHIFHFGCLRSWLERQQSCPTCRRSVLPEATASTPSPQAANGQQAQPQGEQPEQPADQPQQQPLQQQQPSPMLNGTWPFIDGRPGNRPTETGVPQRPAYAAMPPPPPPPPPPFGVTLNVLQALAAQNNSARQASSSQTAFGHIEPSAQNLVPLIPLALDPRSEKHAEEQLPETLTEDQLQALSVNTREAIEERLRILEMVQAQTFRSIQLLSQVLSVLPESKLISETGQSVDDQDERQSKVTHVPVEEPAISDRKREKLPMDTQLPGSTNEHIFSKQEDEMILNNDTVSVKSEDSLIKVENEGSNTEIITPQQNATSSQAALSQAAAHEDPIVQNDSDV